MYSSVSSKNLQNRNMNIIISDSGYINFFSYSKGAIWDTIPFISAGDNRGPSLLINDLQVPWQKESNKLTSFFIENDSLICKLRYELTPRTLVLNVSVKNKTSQTIYPKKISLKIGIDAYMSKYPTWNKKHFPTLLRCEKTHFWGYTMSPEGSVLGIASAEPVASWSVDYIGHHRLGSYNIDLINSIPQPQRHPEGLVLLNGGEEKKWSLHLVPLKKLDDVKVSLAQICKAPMVDATGHYTITDREKAYLNIWNAKNCRFMIVSPSGKEMKQSITLSQKGLLCFCPNIGEFGIYTLTVINKAQKKSEAKIYVRKPWSWYLDKARIAAVEAPPKAAPYVEWFYNVYTAYLAARFIPDFRYDSITDRNFREILNAMYDIKEKSPKIEMPKYVMQWYYSLIGMMVNVYQVTHDKSDLQIASDMADLIIQKGQQPDGAFRNAHGTHYTCVIYIVKPLLELATEEGRLGKEDLIWQEKAERHRKSAEHAATDLLRRLDNIETEGEQTFEDGMISCSALQLGFMALHLPKGELREQYIKAAEYMLNKHQCLEALQVPDCRIIGGTFRFWEAYHDLRITPNMMNTPHGWSSWKTYATYYAYLLTGKEKWLRQTMDAVGSAMQMIDLQTGKLLWGFVPNPYIQARSLIKEDSKKVGAGIYESRLIGEQYLEMKRYWRKDQAGDNDVHEHFKMMAEVALRNAFVLEREDGSLLAYNCSVSRDNGKLIVTPYEPVIKSVHLNLSKSQMINIHFDMDTQEIEAVKGMSWVKTEED